MWSETYKQHDVEVPKIRTSSTSSCEIVNATISSNFPSIKQSTEYFLHAVKLLHNGKLKIS